MAKPDPSEMLAFQLDSVPVRNEQVKVQRGDDGSVKLTVPMRHSGWSRALRHVLPLSEERNVELDAFGSEFLSQCDGRRSVEDLIDALSEKWKLSFFESRGLVLTFLRQLMKRGLVAIVAPADD